MANLKQFSHNMKRLADTVERRANEVKRKVATAILQAVVVATPVGNPTLWKHPATAGYVGGRARANWLVGIDSPRNDTTDTTDAGGGSTISAGDAIIQISRVGQAIHLCNNLPYIIPLNEGHSHQAPIGFIEVAVLQGIQAVVQEKITEG